jgi:hypothetical protein
MEWLKGQALSSSPSIAKKKKKKKKRERAEGRVGTINTDSLIIHLFIKYWMRTQMCQPWIDKGTLSPYCLGRHKIYYPNQSITGCVGVAKERKVAQWWRKVGQGEGPTWVR